jgi:EmrB/QacA subfamily drug resistance transporter
LLRSRSPISVMRQVYIGQQFCIQLQTCVRLRENADSADPKGLGPMTNTAAQTTAQAAGGQNAGGQSTGAPAAAAKTAAGPATAQVTAAQTTALGAAAHAQPEPANLACPDPRRWLILVVVSLAQLMVVLDATIVNIALPSAQHALHFNNIDRQWVVTAYALAFGSLLLLGGRLTDLIGRKATFITGLIGFAAASAAGGAAGSFGMLVAARACQGAFGALLAPAALSLLTTTFGGTKDRGKAFGVFGAIAGGGGAVGLLLGGVLTQYLDWRWCLYVNLIFAAIACAGAVVLLRRASAGPRSRLDLSGLIAEADGMFCVVYGFSNAAGHGWHAPSTWGFLVAGVAQLAAFGYLETRARQPLLPLRIVLDRNRAASYLSILITGAGMFGIFLFLTYYLQETLGFSPVTTGVAFLPMVGAIIVSANLANIVLLPRIGPKFLVAPGMLAAAAGLAWLTRIGVHSSYATDVLPPLLLASTGLGFVMSPSMNTGTADVAPSDAGVASAVVNTGQQVGGSIGTSLLNTMAASAAAGYLSAHLSPRLMVAGRPAPALMQLAEVHSYTIAFWWAAGLFAAGAVVAAILFRRGAPAAPASEVSSSGAAEGGTQS